MNICHFVTEESDKNISQQRGISPLTFWVGKRLKATVLKLNKNYLRIVLICFGPAPWNISGPHRSTLWPTEGAVTLSLGVHWTKVVVKISFTSTSYHSKVLCSYASVTWKQLLSISFAGKYLRSALQALGETTQSTTEKGTRFPLKLN